MASIIDAIIRLKDQFTPTLTRVREQLTETQKVSMRAARDVKGFGESISGIGEAMLPAAVAITAGLGYSAMQFADFSYSIMRTANIARKDGEDISVNLHRLEEAAIGVGSTLPMTINETSEAMANLARAGFDTDMIIGSIGAIGKAAEASGADIALVSDVVTNAMSIWDLKSGDIERNSTRVADVIQQACNKSKMSYDKFSIALATGGNIAASYGEQIEEVAALMGVFANQGIDASSIGTTLKNSYLRLGANADGAADKLEELGVKVFDDTGKMRSMIEIMNDLHKAVKEMSDEELSPLMKGVFGMHAVSGMKKVLQSEEAMKELNELDEAMKNAQGKSQEAFEAMQQTFGGKIKLMESTFDAFVHRFGLALAPMVAPVLDAITSIVSSLNEMDTATFSTLIQIGLGFVSMTAGLLTAGKAISIFGRFASFLVPIGTQLANGATLASLFAGKIASLSTSFALVKNVGTLAISQLFSPLKGLAAMLVSPFQGVAQTAGSMLVSLRAGVPLTTILSTRFQLLANSIGLIGKGNIFARLDAALGKFCLNAVKRIISVVANITSFPAVIASAVRSVITSVRLAGGILPWIINGIRVLSLAIVSNPIGAVLLALGAIVLIVAANWNTFKNVAEVVWNKVSYVVGQVVNTLKATFGTLAENARMHFDRLVALWNQVTGQSQTSGTAISAILNTLGSVFVAAFTVIGSIVELTFASFGSIIEMFMGVAEGLITFLTGVFTGNWSMAWEGIKGVVSSVVKGIVEMVENMAAAISDAVARIRGEEGTAMRDLEITRRQAAVSEQLSQGGAEGMRAIREGNALGTDFWTGGLSWVHEQGPELIDLPNGTRVIPHSSSLREEYERGAADVIDAATGGYNAGGLNTPTILEQAIRTAQPENLRAAERTGNPSSNIKQRTEMPKPSLNVMVTIPKLADQIFVREKTDIENLVNQLAYRFQAHAINRVVHAVR